MVVSIYEKYMFLLKSLSILISLILETQKILIERDYVFLECSIIEGKLICLGEVQPSKQSKKYKIKIIYDGLHPPRVYPIKPEIKFHDDIHIYQQGNLCLYHPLKDNLHWDGLKHNIHDTIIPWTIEWFVYYELYLISGKWEHPFVPHKIDNKKLT